MTIVYQHEEFVTNSGQKMFIEQYGNKPHFNKFWRYGTAGFNGRVWKDMLLTKPRTSLLKELF